MVAFALLKALFFSDFLLLHHFFVFHDFFLLQHDLILVKLDNLLLPQQFNLRVMRVQLKNIALLFVFLDLIFVLIDDVGLRRLGFRLFRDLAFFCGGDFWFWFSGWFSDWFNDWLLGLNFFDDFLDDFLLRCRRRDFFGLLDLHFRRDFHLCNDRFFDDLGWDFILLLLHLG
uniref:(northern house mosquito) hypothetical protein n=1 Tax=Culex pipiens TaxID=7175 RepID=A0A8D8DQC5_CULPI